MTQPVVEDSSQSEMNLENRIDLRAIPPSRAWQQFRQSKPDLAALRAQVLQGVNRVGIELSLQGSSWSVGFLWDLGAVVDALNFLLLSSRVEGQSGPPGPSMLNSQLLENRKLRQASKKLQREAYLARKAAAEKKS